MTDEQTTIAQLAHEFEIGHRTAEAIVAASEKEKNPAAVQRIRASGVRTVERMEQILQSLRDEFIAGSVTSIYVEEKTGKLKMSCYTLDYIADQRMKETWKP